MTQEEALPEDIRKKRSALRSTSLRRPRMIQLVLLFSVLGLQSCTSGDGTSSENLFLNRGISGDPESLDPHLFTSKQAGDILREIGEGLVAYSSAGFLIPASASSWQTSDDGLQYTFYIRPDAKWSNGDQLYAQHFLSAYRRLVTSELGAASMDSIYVFKNARAIIEGEMEPHQLGVTARNTKVLEIDLEIPAPYFLQLLAHPSMHPIHPASIDYLRGSKGSSDELVSNGAYKLNSRVLGSAIFLDRNKYYWDDSNTWFDKIVYHVLSPAAELSRYRAGELDITSTVDPSAFRFVREEFKSELEVAPYLAVYYFGLNLKKPPFFKNKALREALSLAIDRRTLVDTVIGRGEIEAYGIVPPGVDNYESQSLDYGEWSQEQREAEAKRLYASAGYSRAHPPEFELRFNTMGGHEKIATAIQSMWRDVLGLEASLVGEEFKVFIANVMEVKDTQCFRLSWTGDYNDAYSFLQIFESSNPNNLTGYVNPVVDDLLKRASIERESSDRRAYLQEVESIALADHALIPIYFYVSKHLVKPDIIGWQSNILDLHNSKHLRREHRH